MSELISILTAKENWQQKINDKTILDKWLSEASSQNINPSVLVTATKLLKKTLHEKKYYEDSEYDWNLQLNLDYNEIFTGCNCECKICSENEFYSSDQEYSDEEQNEKAHRNYPNCKCTMHLTNKKNNLMSKYILSSYKLVDDSIKNTLLSEINFLISQIPIDFHPHSNDQVIDIVHPSLYPYIHDVSVIINKDENTNKITSNENIIFQWLPSEFEVLRNNKHISVKINSPINNLDFNENMILYKTIADIFALFVPKFDNLLKTLHLSSKIKSLKTSKSQLEKCQVIVKLSNTILNPDKPEFNEASWHLEGLASENIIATGIYYYSVDNIDLNSNYLEFRSTVNTDCIDYPQSCKQYIDTHYGFNDINGTYNDKETTIDIGKISTIEDLCLVFPNFLQHKVSNLKLQDKNKSGTRNILVFFLVNPDITILSTKDVMPLQNIISYDDAKLFRELLMFERKYEVKEQNKFYERGWSFCEH